MGNSDYVLAEVAPEHFLDTESEFYDSASAGNRGEAIVVQAMSADGRSRVLALPFARTKNGVVFGELRDDDSGEQLFQFLNPILRRWPKWHDSTK